MNLIKKAKYGLTIYNSKDIWVGKSIERYGEYSENEVLLFKLMIKENETVIDIGANTGCHTLAFSKFVGKKGKVYAFEPERHNFYTLCGNISLNSITNTFCYNKAIGNRYGQIKVIETSEIIIENYGGIDLTTDWSKEPSYDVDIIKLDNYIFDSINFIKVDVEGMEIDVILGAQNQIQKFKPYLYLEYDREDKQKDLLELLKKLNYKCLLHTPALFNENNYYQERENVFMNEKGGQIGSQNIFCYHESIAKPYCVHALPEIS